ncbi:hypothetical protein CBR_g39137 [Chara braunii]|uniref:FAS1 domain-containing protein n=1 Tax=Chara braunii TaxID=69332 RepID=A0A388LR68_CHABU|nr:hypothetical protein CBR_g39137 [Chara braunii]|eukprot:GBG84759.1 hypothetical protein CBR_g39137 [Chara braunii]
MAAAMVAGFAFLLVVSPVLVHGDPGNDLMKAIKANQNLTLFHQALVATGYSKQLITLVNDKPVTIFAPVDYAVNEAVTGAVSWDCLTTGKAGKAALKESLKHTVINGTFHTVWNLTETKEVTPADGSVIEVTFDSATSSITLISAISEVHIIGPEAIVMENAIVHLVDGVLITEAIDEKMMLACSIASMALPSS